MDLKPALVLLLAGAPAARAAPSSVFAYNVKMLPGGRVLEVDARFPEGTVGPLELERGLFEFMDGLEREGEGSWRETIPELSRSCPKEGCHLRYRLRLGDAAASLRDRSSAFETNGVLVAPPGCWLLKPETAPQEARYRLDVETPPGIRFETGIFPTGSAYEGRVADLDDAPYSAFGAFDEVRVEVPGGVVQLALAPGERDLSREELEAWTSASGKAVASYLGRFPLPRALVLVFFGGRRKVGFGTTMGNGGGSIMVFVGKHATSKDLKDDWVLTHEMIHLSLPDLMPHHWFEEGVATYVEPLARARQGLLSEEVVWRDLVQGLPRGLPAEGDKGLDRTQTWGRVYWGGALFCFLADLEIRERTQGKRSFEDVLRRVLEVGGNISVHWDISRFLAEADRATSVPVLSELYARMAFKPVGVDLGAIWRKLGVEVTEAGVRLSDEAPEAAIRKSFIARQASDK